MWKSGICLRGATLFSPQTNCGYSEFFHTACVRKFLGGFFKNFPQLIFPHSTGIVEIFWEAEVL
jgi:hypothetical protein